MMMMMSRLVLYTKVDALSMATVVGVELLAARTTIDMPYGEFFRSPEFGTIKIPEGIYFWR